MPTPETISDFEERYLVTGESVGLVKDIKPVGESVHGMMEDARQIIEQRLNGMLTATSIRA